MSAQAEHRASHPRSLRLTGGRAARARTGYQGLQRCARGDDGPVHGVVAAAAIERGGYMLNLLGRGDDAVVAALASGIDAHMAEGRLGPGDGAMTRTAVLRGLHVSRRFARRRDAVVAAGAA